MTWSESVVTFTGWTTTIFFYVALLISTPWIIALLYDILLWTWRSSTYNLPVIGGRARGQRYSERYSASRHAPPTFTEHPDGGGRRTPPVQLAEKVVERAGEVVVGAVKEAACHVEASGFAEGAGRQQQQRSVRRKPVGAAAG